MLSVFAMIVLGKFTSFIALSFIIVVTIAAWWFPLSSINDVRSSKVCITVWPAQKLPGSAAIIDEESVAYSWDYA